MSGEFLQNIRLRELGIEPRISAWKAGVLPLNHSRNRLFDSVQLYNVRSL